MTATIELAGGHPRCDAHISTAPGIQLPVTGHSVRDTQSVVACDGAPSSADSQLGRDAQRPSAVVGSTSTGAGQTLNDDHLLRARPGGFLRDPAMGVHADVLDDLETIRIANANRVRILTRTDADNDGEHRGHGLTEDHIEVIKLVAMVDALKTAEADAVKNLERSMKRHPLGKFVKATPGLGLKQTARLLAAIGDPYWNDLYDRPRTVSELWAYCGMHVAGGAAPRRQRGQKSNWNEDARKRLYVIAAAVPKFKTSPYEQVYRDARIKYEDAVHPAPCVRCGPAGKHAVEGSPLSPGHQHARAIRLVGKEILRDLWRESRVVYES